VFWVIKTLELQLRKIAQNLAEVRGNTILPPPCKWSEMLLMAQMTKENTAIHPGNADNLASGFEQMRSSARVFSLTS
jgi:hypothetical protein